MRSQTALRVIVVLFAISVAGCGDRSQPTVTQQDELDAYLADNPEVAQQAPPPLEDDQ